MQLIDTHAHLDFADFEPDRGKLIQELAKAGIGVINPSTDEASVKAVDKLTRKHQLVWGAIGIHPTDITADTVTRFNQILEDWSKLLATNPKLVAIGEIGLDYYRKNESAHHQKAVLRQMLTFAAEHNKPVIFHCRDAYGDLLTMLADYPSIRGVIHCFSGTLGQAEQFLDLGLHLSFTANVTYEKNEELRQAIRFTPLDRLMIETDSPFLAPNDRRGERNDPTAVKRVAETVAQAKNVTVEEVAKATTATALKLFKIKV